MNLGRDPAADEMPFIPLYEISKDPATNFSILLNILQISAGQPKCPHSNSLSKVVTFPACRLLELMPVPEHYEVDQPISCETPQRFDQSVFRPKYNWRLKLLVNLYYPLQKKKKKN